MALLPAFLLVGCRGTVPFQSFPTHPTHDTALFTYTVLADSIPEEAAMEALVAPFRTRMGHEIHEVIGEASGLLAKGWPEGSLGNFASDAVLWGARSHFDGRIEMALMNNGGLRVPVAAGPITVEGMFELMPFDNRVSVLTLTGEQVREVARHIASRGGEPIAGFTFSVTPDAREPVDVRVAGEPLDPGHRYRLATTDYLADGGDEFSVLLSSLERVDLPLLVRDVFIEYVREEGTIDPVLEGRITMRQPGAVTTGAVGS